jgi:DNA-binding beta-propeller fold protein YncE
MKQFWTWNATACGLIIVCYLVVCNNVATADRQPGTIAIPTGQLITPAAATGAIFQGLDPEIPDLPGVRVNEAAAAVVSPDGRLLAILTSGNQPDSKHFLAWWKAYYQRFGKDLSHDGEELKVLPPLSTEYLFLFDVSRSAPKKLQVIPIPHAFQGLAWSASSDRFYVSGGKDDLVLELIKKGSQFILSRTFRLGHQHGLGAPGADPVTAGIALSPDGRRLLAANLQNDSASLIDLEKGQVVAEQDLRPGVINPHAAGEAGGTYPRAVVWVSSTHAYVASERDREILALAIEGTQMRVLRRIPVHGQPVALLANRKGSRLYAALDNSDQIAVFDTAHDSLLESFNTVAPSEVYSNAGKLGGANPNALALTADESTLLVTNGGENAVAVVRLGALARDAGRESDPSAVLGLVPTGWYPTGVAISKSGDRWYVVNAKSEAGPNIDWCKEVDPAKKICSAGPSPDAQSFVKNWLPFLPDGALTIGLYDRQDVQLVKAGFLTIPAPRQMELARLTKQVALNNRFTAPQMAAKDEELFSFLRAHIKHVIFILKENRTYDQILGDLDVGNGDSRLTIFPEPISPNHHAIARSFVTLDNFLNSGIGSGDGWEFSTAARVNDIGEHSQMTDGFGGDWWGVNRNINVGLATSAERHAERPSSPADPNILPSARDVRAPDAPGGEEGKGYIWDAVLRRGLSVRNYGFFSTPDNIVPAVRDAYAQKRQMIVETKPSLIPLTDIYYRGWDTAFPDFWRYQEWKREFDQYAASKALPNLILVELGEDHTGSFEQALDGVNTPETQMADNDYAVGLLIEAVAHSPFANDTLIVSLEDDPWDGADHVDAFRSLALFAGPYVRQHAVVSTRYTTVSVVKTIEEVLGVGHVGLNDALAVPMSGIFDPTMSSWSYKAIVPDVLRSTKLPLPPASHAQVSYPRHPAAYWSKTMAGQDFSGPDRTDASSFNRALWRGLKGDVPYPVIK